MKKNFPLSVSYVLLLFLSHCSYLSTMIFLDYLSLTVVVGVAFTSYSITSTYTKIKYTLDFLAVQCSMVIVVFEVTVFYFY